MDRALFPVFSLIFCLIAFRDFFEGNHLVPPSGKVSNKVESKEVKTVFCLCDACFLFVQDWIGPLL